MEEKRRHRDPWESSCPVVGARPVQIHSSHRASFCADSATLKNKGIIPLLKETHCILTQDQWLDHTRSHRERVEVFTKPYRDRRSRGKSHPILDFLFTYYSFSIGRLETWHPRFGTKIESGGSFPEFYNTNHYSQTNNSIFLSPDKLTDERRSSIAWMITLLKNTQSSSPIFGCYGMHEWAMVYKGQNVRHKNTVPLRLSQEETDAFVESRPIICSHFDAFRFFTPSALPFNKIQPNKDTRENFEQSGCVHANMDLYKWSYKCMPWVGSDFLWKTFKLALKMRELDMRAAPYDLTEFNYTPIRVETTEGKKEYERQQRLLAEESRPIRAELINSLEELLAYP